MDGSDALPDENATESPNGAQPACAGIQPEAADPDARSAAPDRGDPGIDPIALSALLIDLAGPGSHTALYGHRPFAKALDVIEVLPDLVPLGA